MIFSAKKAIFLPWPFKIRARLILCTTLFKHIDFYTDAKFGKTRFCVFCNTIKLSYYKHPLDKTGGMVAWWLARLHPTFRTEILIPTLSMCVLLLKGLLWVLWFSCASVCAIPSFISLYTLTDRGGRSG